MSSSSAYSTGNPVLDNPGVSATLFAILVFCAFVGMLYNSATSHHEGSEHGTSEHGAAADHGGAHGGEHKAAPAAH